MQQRNAAQVCLEWLPAVSAPSSLACDPIATKNDAFFVAATCYGQIKQCCTHFSGGMSNWTIVPYRQNNGNRRKENLWWIKVQVVLKSFYYLHLLEESNEEQQKFLTHWSVEAYCLCI